MREVAEGVHQLDGHAAARDQRVPRRRRARRRRDAARKRRILRQLAGHEVRTHLVTHAHPDHFGSSHAVCEALGLPLWTGAGDAEAIETATPVPAPGRVPALLAKMKMPPAHPVARRLREGDEVGRLRRARRARPLARHIALWRESDRTLVCGDVFFNVPSLRPPPRMLTFDPERNRASMRRLAELRPALALFGHGPPLRDPDRLAKVAG